MKLQSGEPRVTKSKACRTVPHQRPPESRDQAHELLFINQLHNRAKFGPSRRTIGSHVQRHIHRRKRLNSCMRLKSISQDNFRHVKDTHVRSEDSNLSAGATRHKSKFTSCTVPPGVGFLQEHPSPCKGHQTSSKDCDKTLDRGTLHSFTQLPRDTHGFRSDPFTSYPIEFRESIPSAVDYCEQISPHATWLILCSAD